MNTASSAAAYAELADEVTARKLLEKQPLYYVRTGAFVLMGVTLCFYFLVTLQQPVLQFVILFPLVFATVN